MTTEKRYVLDLADVVAIRMDCAKCHASLLVPPAQWGTAPPECPHCGNTWEIAGRERAPLHAFGARLKEIIEQMSAVNDPKGPKPLPYRVRLEVECPEE